MSSLPLFPDPEGIDPRAVPSRPLPGGAPMPAIGMGTFGSDSVSPSQVALAVVTAARLGYRHFDCASVYGNEALIGESLDVIQRAGVPRSELFVTSKLWNDKHAEEDVVPAFRQSLSDLGLKYLDLYLIHWPFPNHHAPGVDVGSRDSQARPYDPRSYLRVWRQLEGLVDAGLVRHIGTSNMTIPKLTTLLQDARIRPAVNEMELHPHFQQTELFEFVVENGIVPVGYSPIGSPGRPERDRTPEDTVDIEDPILVDIARRRGEHPVSVCLRWAIQRGQVPIPFSIKRTNLLSNLRAAVAPPLTEQEMAAIAKIDRHCRLIKGQVFLWPGARGWEDLWDVEPINESRS